MAEAKSCGDWRRLGRFIIALVSVWAIPLTAQVSSTSGSMQVVVEDASGGMIDGAEVTVTDMATDWKRRSLSVGGAVYFGSLKPATYRVSAGAAGFETQSTTIVVLLGHETALRFALKPSPLRESIEVQASAGNVDAHTIPVHTHLGEDEIQQLPINQRNFLDFALLDAGLQRDTLKVHAVAVTSGFNVLGQRPRSNSLQMDGADLNDETTGGVRGSVPMEAVQEFQILVSGYQAEHGRASGGIVNVVTRSGGNALHGSIYGFLRHRSLDATNAFSILKNPPYTRTQYGASAGGALIHNRTFFFVAAEQLRRQESGFSRIALSPGTFSLTAAQQALAQTQPNHPAVVQARRGSAIAETGIDPATGKPPSYGITPLRGQGGVYPIAQRTGAYSARLDHSLGEAHRLAARINYAHDQLSSFEAQQNDQIAGLLSFGRTAALTTLDPTGVLTLNSVLNTRTLNDLRVSASQRKFDMTPNSLGTPVNISGLAFIGRENILPHYRTEKHFHLEDAVTAVRGTHTLKFGGDLLVGPASVEYHRLTNGLFTFAARAAPGAPAEAPPLSALQAYGLGLPSNYVQQFGDPRADAGKTSVGLFVQDSWRINSRFTVDAGLRYDLERAKQWRPESPAMEGVYRRLSLSRSPAADLNNLQPRVGIAYQLRPDGKLTLRTSYGIFYDRLLNLSTYLSAVGDGVQIQRVILAGPAAVSVFQSPAQKLDSYPGTQPPTGLIAFADSWQLGTSQQANFLLSGELRPGLAADAGYVWVRGTHLPRSRDVNPPATEDVLAFLAQGNPLSAVLQRNFFRPESAASEAMAFEGSASSTYHGMRLALRGTLSGGLTLNASYTWTKAIDDAEEIFPHTRAQDMLDFRSERGLALYDQRHRFVAAGVWNLPPGGENGVLAALGKGWMLSPILELGSGRPVNVLLGFDNNLDQEPSSDRPHVAAPGAPGSIGTRYGSFTVPRQGEPGNLGRNAFTGPGFAVFHLRAQKNTVLTSRLTLQFIAEAFNLLNRVNIRAVNPNYQFAGEPLAASDPRQIQLGLRIQF